MSYWPNSYAASNLDSLPNPSECKFGIHVHCEIEGHPAACHCKCEEGQMCGCGHKRSEHSNAEPFECWAEDEKRLPDHRVPCNCEAYQRENSKTSVVSAAKEVVREPSMQSDSAMQRSLEALSEYMFFRTRLGVLELNNGYCHCADFHTCDHCEECQKLNLESRRLMNLWGDNWATMLWSYREELSAAGRD